MNYIKQNFVNGMVLTADLLNHMEEGITAANSEMNVDLSDYYTKPQSDEKFQPKGEYLTEVPEGYAKTEDITGLLPRTELPAAIDTALEQAKLSGEFDGKTPTRGTDYWTDADQESIVQQVITALGTPVFGRVDENNNIILNGELADGTYTYWYEGKDGQQVEIGKLIIGEVENPNLLTIAIDENKNPFVGTNGEIGYVAGYRVNSSNQAVAANTPVFLTGYIPVKKGWVISVENMSYTVNSDYGYQHSISFYDENFNWLSGVQPATSPSGSNKSFYHNGYTSVEGVVSDGKFVNKGTWAILAQFTIEQADVAYMRICAEDFSENTVIKRVIE